MRRAANLEAVDLVLELPILVMEAESALSQFFSEFGYLAPFTILVLCGFGFPLPEEVTMLGSGFLLYQGRVEGLEILSVCFAATLIGDSVPYWLGRIYGRKALGIRLVRRVLHPERLSNIESRFRRNETRAVFVCRFLPGLRLPAWFTAGTLGMSYARFLAVDAAGAAIMTPLFIWLGFASGERIAELESTVENLHQILGFVVVGLATVLVVHLTISSRANRSQRGPEQPDGDRP